MVIEQAYLSVSSAYLVRVVLVKRTMSRRGLASIMHIKWSCIHSPKKRCSTVLCCWCKQYHKITKWMQAQEKSAFSQWNWYFPWCKVTAVDLHQHENGPQDILWDSVQHTIYPERPQDVTAFELHFLPSWLWILYFTIHTYKYTKLKIWENTTDAFNPVKSLFSHTCGNKEGNMVGCLAHNFSYYWIVCHKMLDNHSGFIFLVLIEMSQA